MIEVGGLCNSEQTNPSYRLHKFTNWVPIVMMLVIYLKKLFMMMIRSNHCVRTVHAEQNAICQAAKIGVSLEGATLYCKMTPCRVCAMLIINCGIKEVVCEKKYHAGKESEEMFKQAGITLRFFNDEIEKYDNQ